MRGTSLTDWILLPLAPATYTDALVYGYSQVRGLSGATALTAYQNAVTAKPGLADAVASGAALTGTVALTDVVRYGLANETVNTAPPPGQETHSADILAAIIGENPSRGLAIVGRHQYDRLTPYSPLGSHTTLRDIAWGVADAAAVKDIGNNIQTIVGAIGLVASNAISISKLVTRAWTVKQAILGATAGNNTDAYADITYKAQTVAKNFAGMSDPLVRQAIDAMTPANSYIAVVAALAGDANQNRTTIQNAAYAPTTGEMTKAGGPGGNVQAATDGAKLVAD